MGIWTEEKTSHIMMHFCMINRPKRQNAKFRHIFQTFQAHISKINAHFPMKIDQGNI